MSRIIQKLPLLLTTLPFMRRNPVAAAASSISLPSSANLVFYVNGEQPNGSDPQDLSVSAAALTTTDGTPTFTAASSGVLPGYWSYDGTGRHVFAQITSINEPATIAVLCRMTGGSPTVQDIASTNVPYLRSVYSVSEVNYRWNNNGNFSSGEDLNNVHLLVFNYNGTSDYLEEVSTGTTNATSDYGTNVNFTYSSLGGRGGASFVGDIFLMAVWNTTVASADIKSAIEAVYPGLLS